jgi:AcrR family transcriptional regulator
MGAKERRERERTEMRTAMLTAVREIAATEGWPAVSIRRIAERTEYSPTLLYQYFASKDALVHQIRRHGYEDLLAAMLKAAAKQTDPLAQLRAVAVANVETAFEQPEVFKAMLGMDGTPCDPPPDATAHQEIATLLRNILTRAASSASNATLDGWTEAFFAAVQGVVTMYLNELLPGGKRRAIKTVHHVVDGLTTGWFTA